MLLALLIVNLAIAAIALVRLRPACFILAAHQAVALRAMQNIEQFGRPTDQDYLPEAVFSYANVQTASMLLLIMTLFLLVAVMVPGNGGPKTPASSFPALPRNLYWVLFFYFCLVIASKKTLFSTSYVADDQTRFNFALGGLHMLLVGVTLYELSRLVFIKRVSPIKAFLMFFALTCGTDFLKGSTGLGAGQMLFASIVLLGSTRSSARRILYLGSAIGALVMFATIIRLIRTQRVDDASAVTVGIDTLEQQEANRTRKGTGMESTANGTQTAEHILECITIYDDLGRSRQWKSVYLPIINLRARIPASLFGYRAAYGGRLGSSRLFHPRWRNQLSG